MDTETGAIRELRRGEEPTPPEVEITHEELAALVNEPAAARPALLAAMRGAGPTPSKKAANKAKRRRTEKAAKKARARNRRG